MKVYLNRIAGIDDAFVSMYMSKGTWTRDLEKEIRIKTGAVLSRFGDVYSDTPSDFLDWYNEKMDILLNIGKNHITLLKFIDLSFTVEGLHRAGQDDWDAHAKRYDNRIIRLSSRLAEFSEVKKSNWYQDKIITSDEALELLGVETPETIEKDGVKYVKALNGYVREDMKDNKDVHRGLYMLSLPSNFIFKVNLTEWAHVYKERNKNGYANPEVKECAEQIADLLEQAQPKFTRELFLAIKN